MIELFLKAKHFMPDDYYKTVYDIDFLALKNQGINVLFIDIDNTLIPYDESFPTDGLRTLFETIKKMSFKILIISNNHLRRVRNFSNLLGCLFVASAKKPTRFGFRRAEKIIGCSNPKEICLIGDQMMTDVFGAKRMGYYSIVVDALDRSNEKWFTRMNRRVEKRMIDRLHRINPDYCSRLKLVEKR